MNEHIADKFADLFAKCAVAGDAASLRKEAAAQALVKTAFTPGQVLLPAGAATIGGVLGYYNSEKEKDRLRNALYGALTGGATGVGVQLLRPALQRFFTGGENPPAIPQGGAFNVPDKSTASAAAPAKPSAAEKAAPPATPAAAVTPAAPPANNAAATPVAPTVLKPAPPAAPNDQLLERAKADYYSPENRAVNYDKLKEEILGKLDQASPASVVTGVAGARTADKLMRRFEEGGVSRYRGSAQRLASDIPEIRAVLDNARLSANGGKPSPESFLRARPSDFSDPLPQFDQPAPKWPESPGKQPDEPRGRKAEGPSGAVRMKDYLDKLDIWEQKQKAFTAANSQFPTQSRTWFENLRDFYQPNSPAMAAHAAAAAENARAQKDWDATAPQRKDVVNRLLATGEIAPQRSWITGKVRNFTGGPELENAQTLKEIFETATGKPITDARMREIAQKVVKDGIKPRPSMLALRRSGPAAITGLASFFGAEKLREAMNEYAASTLAKNPKATILSSGKKDSFLDHFSPELARRRDVISRTHAQNMHQLGDALGTNIAGPIWNAFRNARYYRPLRDRPRFGGRDLLHALERAARQNSEGVGIEGFAPTY